MSDSTAFGLPARYREGCDRPLTALQKALLPALRHLVFFSVCCVVVADSAPVYTATRTVGHSNDLTLGSLLRKPSFRGSGGMFCTSETLNVRVSTQCDPRLAESRFLCLARGNYGMHLSTAGNSAERQKSSSLQGGLSRASAEHLSGSGRNNSQDSAQFLKTNGKSRSTFGKLCRPPQEEDALQD